MARPPKPWWNARLKGYYTDAGGKQVRLRYPDGTPVARGDQAGLAEALARHLSGRPAEKVDPTSRRKPIPVWKVCRRWLEWSAERNKERTISTARAILKRFVAHRGPGGLPLGRLPAESLTLEHWASYQAAISTRRVRTPEGGEAEKPTSPRTIRAHFEVVRACWNWASDKVVGRTPTRLVRSNPFADVRLDLKAERSAVRGVLAPAEVAAILEAVDASPRSEGWKLAVRIQAESGCRSDTAVKLRWDQWKGRWFELGAHEHKTGAKTGKALVIPVTAETAARIGAWKGRGHPVWVAKAEAHGPHADRPPSTSRYSEAFAEAARAAGLPDARPYWLRDAFSNEARLAGLDPRVTAIVQGHSPEIAAKHYQTVRGEEAASVAERVAAGRRKPPGARE